MRFVIDAQLPTAPARAITSGGHMAESVRDLGLQEAEDDVIWDYAVKNNAAIITKDEDFAARVWRAVSGPSIVWLRLGNCSNRTLIETIVPLLSEIVERIDGGDRLVEVS